MGAAVADGPLPVGDVVAVGLVAVAAVALVVDKATDRAVPRTLDKVERDQAPPIYHRLESSTQTPQVAAQQQATGELWGKGHRDSGVPYASAYSGPLPDGARGIEFTTPVRPYAASVPGKPIWVGGAPGVRLDDGYAKVPITVTKNTQIP